MSKLTDQSIYLKDAKNIKDMPLDILTKFHLVPFGLSSPRYFTLSNQTSVKYKILTINNEEVLVIFKAVSMYSIQYIRLLGLPKSTTKNKRLELAVLQLLNSDPLVREVQAYEYEFNCYNIKPSNDYHVDFIVNIKDVLPTLNGRYRSKYRINKNKEHFIYRDATPEDIFDILSLTNDWISNKHNKSERVVKSIFNTIRKNPNILFTKDFLTQVLYYDDILFGYSVFSPVDATLYQYVNIVDTFSTNLPQEIIKCGNRIMYYYSILHNKDYDFMNFLGDSDNSSDLFQAKLMLYKTYKKIYRISLKK